MLSIRPIRAKMSIGFALLVLMVGILAVSGLYTTYAYRGLAKSLSCRVRELPVAAELSRQVSTALDTSIRITLLHDGTAAAAAYAGQQSAAVIMMGTALGVGFPGDDRKLRRIGDALG